MNTITGKTKLLGIIGYPVEHSLSPVMQNAALAHMGLDYIYVPFPIEPENLPQAIASFSAIENLVGFNVTIPHKQAIIPLLSQVSDIAQAVGAVNTVWRTENGWSGTNTDVEGFLAPLRNLSPTPSPERGEGGSKSFSQKLASNYSRNFRLWWGGAGSGGGLRRVGLCKNIRCRSQRAKVKRFFR